MKKKLAFLMSLMTTILIFGLFPSMTSQAKQPSYLMDVKKDYLYGGPGETSVYHTYSFVGKDTTGKFKGFNNWKQTFVYPDQTIEYTHYEKETNKGLFYDNNIALPYPIKKGARWTVNGKKYSISSINKTIKVPAGTFKNVIEVKIVTDLGSAYRYYAQNVGLIMTFAEGRIMSELKEVKAKK
ncbi:hypothetical protein [Gottfriedia solisilvae]|uniref:Uncharacterized protein n=2 Tax=Bacteria TaxID=2 RepID=A0A8J3AW74_9BACI|nr:hypothetical protein [Gottfriedia solisilvae]GGI17987.1 hypothetical protein GCM10007380_40680 [Gottfriedia solisilvae]